MCIFLVYLFIGKTAIRPDYDGSPTCFSATAKADQRRYVNKHLFYARTVLTRISAALE